MGIGSDTIEIVARLRCAGLLRRKTAVVEIGAQQLEASFVDAADRLERLGWLFGITNSLALSPATPTDIVHGNLRHLDAAAPPARDFWQWLRFPKYSNYIRGRPRRQTPRPK